MQNEKGEHMKDLRAAKLAKQVIEYSVSLKPGEKVLIEAWDGSEDFVQEFVKAAYRAGGYPYVSLQNAQVNRSFILGASEASMEAWYEYEAVRMKDMDAYIAIRKQDNINEYADVPAEKMALYNKYHGKLHYGHRLPHTKWCVLRYPNPSMAQLSGMSTEAFEDYYFNANCLDYKKMNEIAEALCRRCSVADQVRITGPGTDLIFSVKGMKDEKSYCGIFNRPCGEMGTSVVQGTANGKIRYNIPSSFQGFVFTGVELTLKDGVVVNAVSNNTELMNRILDTDEGARRIGEFAIGFNPMITKPVTDTLFDEKMAMSLHFTPGNGGDNKSAIHWDLVTSHAPELGGGEIWFDGELIRKDGRFVPEYLQCMNPENLARELLTED